MASFVQDESVNCILILFLMKLEKPTVAGINAIRVGMTVHVVPRKNLSIIIISLLSIIESFFHLLLIRVNTG